MQKARGNHCIKKISQLSVVHENCCKSILTIENKYCINIVLVPLITDAGYLMEQIVTADGADIRTVSRFSVTRDYGCFITRRE
jgi:hypothetical protein